MSTVDIDQLGNLRLNFDIYIEDIYLPFINIIFPYISISDPFNSALFEYLNEDLAAFQQKLASLASSEHSKEPDFINTSYEELLNTPVDEGQEEGNSVTQGNNQSVVSSEQHDLVSSSLSSTNPTLFPYQLLHVPGTLSQANASFTSSNTTPSQFYITNVSNGSFSVPSSETVTKDPEAIIVGVQITIGNLNTLVNPPYRIIGITHAADFPLRNIPIKLLHGEITFADALGDFTYHLLGTMPHAESFTYYYTDGQQIYSGNAYISEVQNESFIAPVTFNESAQAISFSYSGSLLLGDAAAVNSTLSVAYVFDPSLGPSGLYFPEQPIPAHGFVTFQSNIEPGASTTITVHADGSFQLTSTVIDPDNPDGFGTPFDLHYIVDNGHGQEVVVSATITPDLTPIVLDIGDVGFNLISSLDSNITLGQLTGSNISSTVGWVGQGNGILMYDPKGQGQLTNLNQISFISYTPGAQTDLQGLHAFDSNHDNKLDAQDAEFSKFGVLLSNSTFESLTHLGIVSISLNSQSANIKDNGNTIVGISSFQTMNGQSHLAGDVSFAIAPKSTAATTLSLNDVIQDNQAVVLQANTISSTASTSPVVTQTAVNDAQSNTVAVAMITEHLIPIVTEATHLV